MKSVVIGAAIGAAIPIACGACCMASATAVLEPVDPLLQDPNVGYCGLQAIGNGIMFMVGGIMILTAPVFGAIGALIGWGHSSVLSHADTPKIKAATLPPSTHG